MLRGRPTISCGYATSCPARSRMRECFCLDTMPISPFETSKAGVLEKAKNLLNLNRLYRVNNKDRPLMFIAHSLGGIILKRALVEGELDHSHKAIRAATYGIAFFGTPHRGGRNVKLGSFAASMIRGPWAPSNTFIEVLKKDSLFADALQNDFQHQLEDYKVLSFYETRPMGKLGLVCRSAISWTTRAYAP
jgi:hypothetical protein